MRALMMCLLASITPIGCESAQRRCSDGAKLVIDDMIPGRASRYCQLPDGRLHGEVFRIDKHGREHLAGEMRHGKKHGRWRAYDHDGNVRSESHHVNGQNHGSYVVFGPDGVHQSDCDYVAGVLHGTCVQEGTTYRDERHFSDGRRTGIWRELDAGGNVKTHRIYANSVLLAVDGRPLPPPPDTIATPRSVVNRSECVLASRAQPASTCLDLFEAYQRCALDDHVDECIKRAISAYLATAVP
jgi:hypothetical protein